MVACPEGRTLLAVDGHGRLALDDHEEADPRLALHRDRRPGLERTLLEGLRQHLQVALLEPREERNLGELLGRELVGHDRTIV